MCSYIIYNFIKKETGFYTFFFELKQLESLEMNYSLSGSVCSHFRYIKSITRKKETIILFQLLHIFRYKSLKALFLLGSQPYMSRKQENRQGIFIKTRHCKVYCAVAFQHHFCIKVDKTIMLSYNKSVRCFDIPQGWRTKNQPCSNAGFLSDSHF
jgi:hypothetical protein